MVLRAISRLTASGYLPGLPDAAGLMTSPSGSPMSWHCSCVAMGSTCIGSLSAQAGSRLASLVKQRYNMALSQLSSAAAFPLTALSLRMWRHLATISFSTSTSPTPFPPETLSQLSIQPLLPLDLPSHSFLLFRRRHSSYTRPKHQLQHDLLLLRLRLRRLHSLSWRRAQRGRHHNPSPRPRRRRAGEDGKEIVVLSRNWDWGVGRGCCNCSCRCRSGQPGGLCRSNLDLGWGIVFFGYGHWALRLVLLFFFWLHRWALNGVRHGRVRAICIIPTRLRSPCSFYPHQHTSATGTYQGWNLLSSNSSCARTAWRSSHLSHPTSSTLSTPLE
ncbi:uncharacterized protein CC84DRAFT_429622 [Paraphaeosphaeria sporulosa]|uniref:Uncharacterized protein n=1 Tax=Paraphaeosphaeria sporulosa TaxID=1460663 RepID=A0A177BV73_9PLEO|nr:uncharacterized protein CC84DRAFT_429622 [Paraphaeosphaeria sporulosa]OAF98558.1 hypothetical protein CC84DRAFT_429622 [Paraphaeosphaeria sporulosa]